MAIPDTENSTTNHPVFNSRPQTSGKKNWVIKLLIWIVIIAVAVFAYRHFSQKKELAEAGKKEGKKPAIVTVTPAKVQDINVYLNAIGTVTPRNTVVVRTRIDGQLDRVLFNEGQYVKQGELLAEIDPKPSQVLLIQAQGQLAKDQALLKNAQLDLERYKKLLSQDSAPEQQVATQNSLVNQYQGTIQTDQSQIDSAKLQLSYTRITAPIAGRVGLRQVDAGNLVHQTDTNGILSIAQVKPITVIFSIPQDNLANVLAPLRKGDKLDVDVYGREQKNKLAQGVLQSADNQIDTTTGTVKLKAQFANEDESLFPNQFVNVRVLVGINKDAVVVANSAVQRGSQGTFVYQVLPDHSIAIKPVKVTVTEGEFSAVEAQDGGAPPVKAGDLLVTSGADKLREGAKVQLAKDNPNDKTDKKHGHWSGNRKHGDASPDATASDAKDSDDQSNANNNAEQSGGQHHRHKRSAEE